MEEEFLDGRVIVTVGDITSETTDAIVNAANKTLLGGGGVDGAIHRSGGPEILAECKKIRENEYRDGLPTGDAVITTGGNLLAKYVIHTVGPIYRMTGGRDAELLAASYTNSLKLAAENNLESISFPSISTGAFGYPKHEAAHVSSRAIRDYLAVNEMLKIVRLVFFSEADARKFIKHASF